MLTTKDLVKLADGMSEHTGLKLTTIGTYAAQNGAFFDGLKDGRTCTLKKASRLLEWFSASWPTDLEWPAEITRPKPAKKDTA